MSTFRDNTVQLDQINIHYLSWGAPEAPPVLLLHGYLDIAHSWCALGEALADKYHVVAPHFRGHGDSSWAPGSYGYFMPHYVYDWYLLLEHLGWDQFTLIGHSMGANCASLFAGTYPKRVQKLVMVEGFGVPTWVVDITPERLGEHIKRRHPEGLKPNKTFASLDDVTARIMKSHPRYTQTHAKMLATYSTKVDEEGRYHWKFDPRMRIPNPAMYLVEQFQAFWRKIEAPTLQVIGEDSPFAFFAQPDLWPIPNLALAYLPGAMHMVQHEIPDLFNEVVQAFLEDRTDALTPYLRKPE